MKLTRTNYKLMALVGLMLTAGTTSIALADDSANAANKGVELRKPATCGKQLPSLPVTTSTTTDLPITTDIDPTTITSDLPITSTISWITSDLPITSTISSIIEDPTEWIVTFSAPGTYTVTVGVTSSTSIGLPTSTFLGGVVNLAQQFSRAMAHDDSPTCG